MAVASLVLAAVNKDKQRMFAHHFRKNYGINMDCRDRSGYTFSVYPSRKLK
jgi:hypothetical protein